MPGSNRIREDVCASTLKHLICRPKRQCASPENASRRLFQDQTLASAAACAASRLERTEWPVSRRPAVRSRTRAGFFIVRSWIRCEATSISKSRSPSSKAKIEELRSLGENGDAVAIADEIAQARGQGRARRWRELYAKLTPWQKTQVARHPQRPHFVDYCAGPDRRFHAARRRPQIRRGRGHRGRLRPLPRPSRSACSARRRAPTPRPASRTISAWRGRRATARRYG